MNWNKTEIFGDDILLNGVIVTDSDADNYQATRSNMSNIAQIIVKIQKIMAENNIDSIQVSWSGSKLLRKNNSGLVLTVNTKQPN